MPGRKLHAVGRKGSNFLRIVNSTVSKYCSWKLLLQWQSVATISFRESHIPGGKRNVKTKKL